MKSIQEHIPREKVEASSLWTYSQGMASQRRIESYPSTHAESFVSVAKVEYCELTEGQGKTIKYILENQDLRLDTNPLLNISFQLWI